MVDETTLPVSSGEASPAAPAPEEQGPGAPTKSYRLTSRAPGGTFLTQPAEPLREEEGPPIPPRGIGGGIADWIENQRSVAGTYGYEHPAVSSVRSFADHVGLKRDDSYDPWQDIEGTDFAGNAQFLKEAMFVGSRGELDLLKRRHMEEEANAQIRSQNPVSAFVWGILGAPFDPTNLLPGGAVYRSGRLGLGIARSALEGAVAGAAGGLASEMIAQNTLHTRTPQDLLTSTAIGAGFGGLIGIGGSVLGEVLGRSASQLSKAEFNRLAQKIEVGPRPVFDDVRRQLVEAGLAEEEAAANAAILEAHYAARAERRGLGESAFDLYRKEGIDLRAGEAPEALSGEQLGQFAGPSARTADPAKLANAEDMERRGWDKDAVWMATGWGRGADGKWRFEIPDDLKGIGADVPDRLRAIPAGHGIRLRELYRNPDLEKAYPQVFDLPVATTSRGDGAFDEKAGIIWLNPKAPVEQVRLALIHEIQHAIQAEEGFARGSSSRVAGASAEAATGRMAGAAEKVQARVALLGESPENAAAFVAKHERLDADELAQWAGKAPDELRAIRDENRPAEVYRRNSGEAEARNTEARSAMSGEERLSSPPWDTEDVPRERQIVREGDDRFYQSVPEQGFLGEAQGKVIDDTLSGVSKDKPVLFPSTPKVFTALGVKDTPVVLPPSVIWKAVDKHHLTPAEIKGAVDALSNPVMVFDSASSSNSLVALVDVAGSQKPIVVALHHNEKVGRTEISRIASIHAKESGGSILNWMTQGLTRYFNKWKAGAWVRSRGLQLPKDGSPRNRQGLRVLQHRDIFNSELKQSGEGAPRGAITMESNRALIELFRGRDQSTFMHESSHLWLSELIRDAEVSPAMKEDLDQVLAWLGVDDASRIGRAEHEKWAQGFEQYLRDGKAPYEPPSFLRWIARQGGVSDPNGTLKGSDISLRGVVAAKGRSFDQLGERIAEEAGGLLPGRPGANEVEDWIVQAARGEEPGWWTARHLDAEHAGQSRVAQEIQQMAAERGVTLRTLDDVATFLRGEEGRPQTLEDLERRVAGEEGMRSEGMTGGALAEEARQALAGALGDRASARAAVRDAMVALAGVRRRMGRAETKAEEALRALTANKDRMETLSDRAIDLSVRRQMLEAAMANHEAEASALRGKMEEVVGAWNGNSSKGAKRSLEKREAAGEGMPADAPRLKTADAAVDDAVEAILKTRTDLTPDELRARADETWQRVVGTPAGRFPYDDQATTGAAIRTGREELGRTFQGRTFAMPFETKAKWLETDIEHLARVMIEQMEMDMAIVQRFGSVTDMGGAKQISSDGTMVFREIADEAQRQMDQFAADYQAKNGREPTAKEMEASNERIRKRADDDIRTLMKLLERQRGFFGMPDNPQGIEHQAARVARGFNILTSLGSVLISSMSDLATPLVRHGMIELLGNGWLPLVSSIGREVGGRAKEELKLMGVGLDLELNARIAAFSDVLDDYGRGSPLERAVGAGVNKFMALTMLPQWTDMGERVVGYTVMSKTLKAAQAATEGRLSARQREMLADLGISEPMAARIWKEFSANNGGERFNGLWLTNTSAWGDRGAAEAMSIAVGRGVERSIVRPGLERPFWSQGNEVGRLVFQFQSFMTATAQTVTLAGIQQRDARAIMGFAAMIGLGAMSYAARQAVQGREVPTDPVKLVVEGLSTSGLLGWLDQANTIAEKATSGRVGLSALTGEYTSRYSNVNEMGTLLGPVAGKVQDAVFSGGRFIGDMARPRGQAPYAHRADLAALRRSFLPGQNFWFLRRAIDNLEDGLGDALGMKPRKRTLKVGAQ